MISRAALLACVAACWTGSSDPTPPPLRPEPIAAAKPKTARWRKSPPRAHVEQPARERSPSQIAGDLARELRSSGTLSMQSFIAGPIVVLDLDSGSVSTLCDLAAVAGAQTWGAMFADPARSAPHCRASTSYTCTQFSHQSMLIVELAEPDAWRIVSVIVGNYRAQRATLHSQMSQLRAQVSTATCP